MRPALSRTLAKVVLSVSSIEALAADNDSWTEAQLQMIEWAADAVHRKFGDPGDPVADAIRRTHHRSLRQQTKRLLQRYGLLDLWPKWDDVYGRRSRLFHGRADDESPDIHQLARDSIRLCGGIVLSIARREGAVLPTVAGSRFPIL